MSDESPFPRLIQDYVGWIAITMLVLGRRTGMLDAVLEGPVTADALAARARVDRRNAEAWLAAMTAHGYLSHAGGVFTMPEAEREAFRTFPYDLVAILDFVQRASGIFPEIEQAIRKGAGISPAFFHERFGDCVGRIPARFYEMVAESWLEEAGVAGVLRDGGSLLELAPGRGGALLHLAGRFPRARLLGVDLDAASVAAANADAAARGHGNVRFAVGDVSALEGPAVHDVVIVMDAFHHFADPMTVLRSVRNVLRPGGRLIVAESTATGDLDRDAPTPFGPILLGSNLLYCMQEGLHGGGAGLGTTYGTANYEKLLSDAGFTNVGHKDTESGFTLITGSPS